jgi:F0F1-type ATP synthase delta subunit
MKIRSLGAENFHAITNNFLATLVENKRLDALLKIADKYIDYYRILNKEESIRIISAKALSDAEKKSVVEALKQSHKGI